ncbi:hypothetical protein P691DRAFT_781561 [Macrolepiota fuliginosa MF-IS2]|uniref:Uncharacterized protein n=1 Tax=Macrolepiota fuliginosa MF-IS2 TaxID=1400762 RepID=A0A9P5WZR8_9AGAR|nr:hypothetical protein P691DRAFT_781561 [Macrolepiota fuliginosa MF-IS2]
MGGGRSLRGSLTEHVCWGGGLHGSIFIVAMGARTWQGGWDVIGVKAAARWGVILVRVDARRRGRAAVGCWDKAEHHGKAPDVVDEAGTIIIHNVVVFKPLSKGSDGISEVLCRGELLVGKCFIAIVNLNGGTVVLGGYIHLSEVHSGKVISDL